MREHFPNPMTSWIETRYLKLASKKIVAVSGVVYVVSQAAIGYLLLSVGHINALKLQLTLSARTFAHILAQWGDLGAALYIKHFYLDYFHAVIYAMFLSSAIAFLTSRTGKRAKAFTLGLFVLPWVAALCDIAENTIHLYLIRNHQAMDIGLVIISGICTWTKWALAAISVAVILGLLWKGRKRRLHETRIIQDA
jgi:hypothetical protein